MRARQRASAITAQCRSSIRKFMYAAKNEFIPQAAGYHTFICNIIYLICRGMLARKIHATRSSFTSMLLGWMAACSLVGPVYIYPAPYELLASGLAAAKCSIFFSSGTAWTRTTHILHTHTTRTHMSGWKQDMHAWLADGFGPGLHPN